MNHDRMEELVRMFAGLRGQPDTVFLYPHTGIDGDAIGSTLAMLMVLRRAGITARFVYDEVIPAKYGFLPGVELIEPFAEDLLPRMRAEQTLALALDCSESSRTGRRQELFDQAPQVAVIDHHVSEGESGPLRLIDPTAAATGELIWELARQLERTLNQTLIDHDVAVLLMTAIISDTGRFTFSNTTARTFAIASELMLHQVDIRSVVYQLFDLTSPERLNLTGHVYEETRYYLDGRVAVACVSQELLYSTGADASDLDGLAGHLRNVAGVEVSLLIRELADGGLRVNIRSGASFNSATFARSLGGGGHARAAGLQLEPMPMRQAADLLVAKVGEWL
ncbi:MAG: DHH family phosphoesterase [Eubacteriales bacterium]|nr:DHH family phosphoesterase [Eubacteriales bacterium]